jgi:hypothetical protein
MMMGNWPRREIEGQSITHNRAGSHHSVPAQLIARGSGADCDFVINAAGRTYGCGGALTRLCRALCADACLLAHYLSGSRTRGGEVGRACNIHSSGDRVPVDHMGG